MAKDGSRCPPPAPNPSSRVQSGSESSRRPVILSAKEQPKDGSRAVLFVLICNIGAGSCVSILDMCAVIQADKSTETAVQAMAGKVAALEADLAVGRMALYAGAAPILTDAQKQQLAGIE